MSDPARPRIGVIGVGWWASTVHIPALSNYPMAEVVALCDVRGDTAERVANQYGIEHVFDDPASMVAAGLVDGVVIATPHDTHARLAREAIDAGVHCLVEKPLALDAATAWDLVARAERRGVHLSVGYTYQHAPAAGQVRQWLADGEVGTLVQVVAQFSSAAGRFYLRSETGAPPDLTGPSPDTYGACHGGGQAHTQLTHLLGLILWQTGTEAEEVYACVDHRHAGRRLAVDVTDALTFRLVGGALCVAASTGIVVGDTPFVQAVTYHGTTGLIGYDLQTGQGTLSRADGLTRHAAVPPDEPAYPRLQVSRAFADLIRGAGPDVGSAHEAAATVALLDALHRSAQSHGPEPVLSSPAGLQETKLESTMLEQTSPKASVGTDRRGKAPTWRG